MPRLVSDSFQPQRLLAILRDHHLPNMHPEHKRAVLLRAVGLSDQEAADLEHVSLSTFKCRLHVATCHIAMCLPSDTRLNADLRGAWVALHQDCLAEVIETPATG